MRLLFITDFTEQFAYRFLRGILNYSQETEQWVVCKMPPAYKRQLGLEKVVAWAKEWRADAVIAQFEPDEDVTLFRRNGIVALAQDYISKFTSIPNITGDYELTGNMAAEYLLSKGFKHFGFFGYNGVCWSDERMFAFRSRVEKSQGGGFYYYDRQNINNMWYYDQSVLIDWLKNLPKPIAIMACDDNQANILLQACEFCGFHIPDDVAVLGVDNDEILCNMSSQTMSTINIDIEGGGYDAAAMIDKMVKDPSFPGHDIVLRPLTIVERLSTSVFAISDKEVLKALRYIHANIESKIQVTDVLANVPISRRLLEQRFKKVTGTSIYNYISFHRIERFAQMLISSKDPLSEIAAKLDEFDTKSISRRFKEIKGCTPSEFRRNYLRKV